MLLIGAGVTLHEAVTAHGLLKPLGINARVLDPFTIKPLDVNGILKHANACGGRIVVVEDHYYAGVYLYNLIIFKVYFMTCFFCYNMSFISHRWLGRGCDECSCS